MAHTPTPWVVPDNDHDFIASQTTAQYVCRLFDRNEANYPNHTANAQRIVACVNACEGIDNPAEYIERLRQMYKTAYQGCEDRDKEIQALLEYNAKLFAQLDALVKLTETIPSLTFTPEYRYAAFTVRTTCEHSDAAQDEPEFETPEPEFE